MRVAAYSVLCITVVLLTVVIAAALVPPLELLGAQRPNWRLVQNLLRVGFVGAIGGALAAVVMHVIANRRISAKSYIYPTVGTFWGVAIVLVAWKFASPTSFSTGIVQILGLKPNKSVELRIGC